MEKCQFCGLTHGKICPQVKAIEYFANGTIKRVEFKCAGDYAVPMPSWPPQYNPPVYTPTVTAVPNAPFRPTTSCVYQTEVSNDQVLINGARATMSDIQRH